MAKVTYTTRSALVPGPGENINDVTNCLDKLLVGVNSIDEAQFSDTLARLVGLTNGTTKGRGKCIVSGSESRTNTAYGLLTTPDRVQGIYLPSGGLLHIAYHAVWQASTTTPGAAIFLGSNEIKQRFPAVAAPVVSGTATSNFATNNKTVLGTSVGGLKSEWGTAYTGDVATGQILGSGWDSGFVTVFADAGTYDVSVQFKVASGSVTVENRKLFVLATGF